MDLIEHWQGLRDRYLEDASLLIKHNRDHSGMLILCSFIDAASSYFAGRTSERGVGSAFRSFVERYLPMFKNVRFGDLLFGSGERVNDIADMLYYCYRNGLIHEGHLPYGIKLVRKDTDAFACNICAIGTMELNILGMFNYIASASMQFENDLKNNENVKNNYKARMDYLNRPRFKKLNNT